MDDRVSGYAMLFGSLLGVACARFRGAALCLRQDKAAAILSEALKRLAWKEFLVLRGYVFKRLEK